MEIKPIDGQLLLKNGVLLDPFLDQETATDILIDHHRIRQIDKQITPASEATVIDIKGLKIAPGFVDLHTHLREPGYEERETLETGSRAALAGGFTQLCCMPNTDPAIDNLETIKYIYRRAETLPVHIYPIAAITKNRQGEELTEMAELAEAGAVAFSDDGNSLQNPLLMRYALEYAKIANRPIINHAEDIFLRNDGLMNEGPVSTRLGLSPNPVVAEELMVYRDIRLAQWLDARVHIPHVSSAGSVEMIRRAKSAGVRVTAEATPHHFSLTDEYLSGFDTNGKMAPPLRSESDRLAVIAGLKDGTIDAIATDHAPHPVETKETSFDMAASGIIGLETAFCLAMTCLVHKNHLTLMDLVRLLTTQPAAAMGIPLPELKPGEPANLTVFDPDEWWVFSRKDIYSKSQNTPFIGWEFTGRIKAVISRGQFIAI